MAEPETIRRVNFLSSSQQRERNTVLLEQPPDHTLSITSSTGGGHSYIFNNDELMYPVKNLFDEVVKQEGVMWNKTQGVQIPIEEMPTRAGGEEIEEELLSVGRGSFVSFHSSVFNPDNALYLMKYGRLTKSVHKYFRKLEKEHACLYLSGRRANFQNLRLHNEQRQPSATPSDEGVVSVGGTTVRIHSLRDEERFVYRCALMASQFPMLSAPGPPEDGSPSPPFPILPIGTAPSESSISMAMKTDLHQQHIEITREEQHLTTDSDPIFHSSMANGLEEPDVIPKNGIEEPTSAFKPVMISNGLHTAPITIDTTKTEIDPTGVTIVTPPTRSKSSKSINRKHRTSRSSFRAYGTGTESDEEYDRLHKKGRDTNGGGGVFDHNDDELVRICNSKESKFLDPLGRDHPFPAMVNREMLCSLVRRSFNQTEEQQIQYEQILRHENGRKSKGEILARELVAQLEMLENNAHPFYKPRNFVTRNGYDIWLQGEKRRIRDQLERFWHYKLPTPSAWSRSTPYDYHKAYSLLQEKVICSESKSQRREPVHGGRTPSSPLSATAQRLLTEFGLRYGVGELYQQIVYLEYLAKHFDYEVWYIRYCTEQLRLIRSLLPRNRAKSTATRKEMETLKTTVYLLHGQTDNSLTRIDRLFQDSDPQLGVAALIDLLKEILDTEHTLFSQRVKSVEDSLQKYLKAGFAIRYERRKEIISDEISVSKQNTSFELCPILVNALLLSIREEVTEYRDVYQTVFRRYFNIAPFAQTEFYRLMCSDACSLCAKAVYSPSSRQKLDLEMLGLLYRLNERDQEWSNVITLEMQQWRNQFVHLALIWIDVLAKQIKQWILTSLKEDQWAILTFHLPVDTIPNDSSRPSSCNDIISPFSPPLPSISTHSLSVPLSHTASAFTPVQKVSLSPLSEQSGGLSTEFSSSSQLSCDSSSSRTVGGGNGRGQPRSDLLKFSKRVNDGGNNDDVIPSSFPRTPPPIIPPLPNDNHTPNQSPDKQYAGIDHTHKEWSDRNDDCNDTSFQPASMDSDLTHSLSSSLSPPTSVSCLSATVSGLDSSIVPARVSGEEEESTTPTMDDEDIENVVRSKMVTPRRFIPVRGPVPMPPSHSMPPPLLVSVSPVKVTPRNPPKISLVHNLSDSTRLYQTYSRDATPTGRDATPTGGGLTPFRPSSQGSSLSHPSRPSLSPPLSPSSNASSQMIPCYFPVSSSPIDLITMFDRLASFIGSTIKILTPRVKRGLRQFNLEGSLEVPREVLQARRLVTSIQQQTENMRIEFLRKIHKVLLNSIKLYVDNMLCMDLCCWKRREAIDLLGEDLLYNLQRRMESGEIWGCRHIVEARNGLHPNGLPCSKNIKMEFESISRDMCIRVNNTHMLLTIYADLETHVYNVTVDNSNQTNEFERPDLSSESGSNLKLDGRSPQVHSSHAFPHRYRPEKKKTSSQQKPINILPTDEGNTTPSSDTGTTTRSGLGMTPLSRRKIETGFQSNESNQLIEYLKVVQASQLKMICIRMNRFFKPALSLLLDLKLGSCPIERRLDPLTTFLTRHCNALKKYLYPECYSKLMDYLWYFILEDIEKEAIELTKAKKRVVSRSALLLGTTSHLIKTFHRDGGKLSLEKLTSSTEYVLALLNVFLMPTEKLIQSFNRLSSPHFNHDLINLDQSPVVVEPKLIYSLSKQLHGERKCFTGRQFVEKLTELGRISEEGRGSTPDLLHSTPTNTTLINYDIPYAIKLGQYLLSKGILVLLCNYEHTTTISNSSTMESVSSSRLQAMDTTLHMGLSSRNLPASPSSSSTSSTPDSLAMDRVPTHEPMEFKNSSQVYYRFINMEDSAPEGSFFQRMQILSATPTALKQQENRMNISEFDHARFGTLFLIIDVCQNRSRNNDRQAKDFLQRNETLRISSQRVGNNINCSKIFRI